MCILDLSNVLMNELHYGCMKKKKKKQITITKQNYY